MGILRKYSWKGVLVLAGSFFLFYGIFHYWDAIKAAIATWLNL